jgi:hypothetical protein
MHVRPFEEECFFLLFCSWVSLMVKLNNADSFRLVVFSLLLLVRITASRIVIKTYGICGADQQSTVQSNNHHNVLRLWRLPQRPQRSERQPPALAPIRHACGPALSWITCPRIFRPDSQSVTNATPSCKFRDPSSTSLSPSALCFVSSLTAASNLNWAVLNYSAAS